MAAENWALGELANGGDPDLLIRQLVLDNECVASLALALVVARQANVVSDTVQPLIETLRVWRADVRRSNEEPSFGSSLLIGFIRESDRPHALAVDLINKRLVRRGDIRWLAAACMFDGDPTRAARVRAAILGFEGDAAYDFEEQKEDPGQVGQADAFAASMAQWAKPENYRGMRDDADGGQVSVYYVDPETQTAEGQSRVESARNTLTEHALFAWVDKCFEHGALVESLAYPDAVALARRIEGAATTTPLDAALAHSVSWGAVAGTAAVALRFRDASSPDDRRWGT